MLLRPTLALLFGALLSGAFAWLGARANGPAITERLEREVAEAIADMPGGQSLTAEFVTDNGLYTRHPLLEVSGDIGEAERAALAEAVFAVPGIGGIRWVDHANADVANAQEAQSPLHCQEDVDGLLRARSIRFEESSAEIDRASLGLVGEVAEALRPCLGAIISITGHTDRSGSEPGNLALSRSRALAVRQALRERGIPADGLRTRGIGSRQPVEGLEPTDPANRRIEFRVLETVPLIPTPIDTPGPR